MAKMLIRSGSGRKPHVGDLPGLYGPCHYKGLNWKASFDWDAQQHLRDSTSQCFPRLCFHGFGTHAAGVPPRSLRALSHLEVSVARWRYLLSGWCQLGTALGMLHEDPPCPLPVPRRQKCLYGFPWTQGMDDILVQWPTDLIDILGKAWIRSSLWVGKKPLVDLSPEEHSFKG